MELEVASLRPQTTNCLFPERFLVVNGYANPIDRRNQVDIFKLAVLR